MKLWKMYFLLCTMCCSVFFASCSSNDKPAGDNAPELLPGASGETADAGPKHGKKIYNQYCSTCHQAKGDGIESVYPPLVGSEFLKDKQKTGKEED